MASKQTDSFEWQQTNAYREGRKAQSIGKAMAENPYRAETMISHAWLNGRLDAAQGIGNLGFQTQQEVP